MDHPNKTEPSGDLSALAWVHEELRKTLDSAHKSLKRQLKAGESTGDESRTASPPTALLQARVLFHQGVGALKIIEQTAPARLLAAAEEALQGFLAHPESLHADAVAVLEHSSFAVLDYLRRLLAGRPVSSLQLFVPYREVTKLTGSERAHPADLWNSRVDANRDFEAASSEAGAAVVQAHGAEVRQSIEAVLLPYFRSSDRAAARKMGEQFLSLAGLAAGRTSALWRLAAAFFDAQAVGLLQTDLYAKRMASRLLQQLREAERGEVNVPDGLVHDLKFFCSQSVRDSRRSPLLHEVCEAYGIGHTEPVDYEMTALGRFDPGQIPIARRRVAALKETWAAVSEGELALLAAISEQAALVADSVQCIYPEGERLARSLQAAVEVAVRQAQAPKPELAMEVATALLCLDASLDEVDPEQPELQRRIQRLSDRLHAATLGQPSAPLEPWVEALYRDVSDRQSMGSVVQELRAALAEIEGQLDRFIRSPGELEVLAQVPTQLGSMRGVLSVLGLDQAAAALQRMRDDVRSVIDQEAEPTHAIERLADSLGAMAFLIDLLGAQPHLAKSLFAFNPETGVFSALIGRAKPLPEPEAALAPVEHPSEGVAPSGLSSPLPVAPTKSAAPGADDEMREIFQEEALEVIAQAREALVKLETEAGDLDALTGLRRGFHTLKGSARMVGLRAFGELGWACEQLFNVRLAESMPKSDPALLAFSRKVLVVFADWIPTIGAGDVEHPEGAALRAEAEALRTRREVEVPTSAPVEGLEAVLDGHAAENHAVAELPSSGADFASTGLPSEFQDAGHFETKLEVESSASAPAIDAPPEAKEPEPEAHAHLLTAQEPESTLSADHSEDLDAVDFDFEIEHDVLAPGSPSELLNIVAEAPPIEDWESTAYQAPAEFSVLEVDLELDLADLDAPENLETPDELESPVPAATQPPRQSQALDDDAERFKMVGPLRIQIALFNIFLNEADEQSRRLVVALSEWQHELLQPVSEHAVALAHSLAGNSATVGFVELSALARHLEHGLERAASRASGDAREAELFLESAEEIRRLLHQFAAGILMPVNPDLWLRLQQLAEEASVFAVQGLAPLEAEVPEPSQAANEPVPVFLSEPEPEPEPEPASELSTHDFPFSAFASAALSPVVSVAESVSGELPSRSSLGSDLQSADVIDEELFQIFVEEAAELLAALAEQLRLWEAHPEEMSGGVGALRALHTFKGGARLAGAMRLGEAAHRLESSIEQMMAQGAVSATLLGSVHQSVDDLSEDFERLRSGQRDPRQLEPDGAAPALLLDDRMDGDAQAQSAFDAPAFPEPTVVSEVPSTPALEENIGHGVASERPSEASQLAPPVLIDWARWLARVPLAAAEVEQGFAESPSAGSVRVRALTLDRMVGQAGEVGVARARMESDADQMQLGLRELTDNLERLRRQLRDLELQAESQMASRIEAARTSQQAFDPLEMDRFTRVQELTRMMAESVNDVSTVQRGLQQTLQSTSDQLSVQARLNRDLQDDLLKARMIEFDTLSDRLYRVVRQAAKESAKQVRLNVEGGGIELDRSVLDRISPPLEHLLRNAVVHGIELTDKRAARGKPLVGTIEVALRQTGNEVQIEVSDDGGGLDLLRIADRARAMGLLAQDASASDAELAALIFHPGMSTADQVSELAGRGIGMEVVRSEVTAMGGRIETSSSYSRGTAFRMLLPLTTAVTQVVILESGRQMVAVPSTLVEVVRRVPATQVSQAYQTGRLSHGGEELPFFWLGSLLQDSLRGSLEGRNVPVVVVRSANQRVAIHVSQVVGNQEAVVKNLGPQLARLPGLTGMTVLSSGQAVLIYNPVALAAVYGAGVRQRFLLATEEKPLEPVAAEPEAVAQAPLVMVVDDSLTVRRVTQRLLLREGYRVALAKDGLDALELVADEVPAVMLCDIEMPRMDGFDVVRNLRAEPRWAKLPVIMITSRIADKHREHALKLGVDRYLGKPYDEDELLSLVRVFVSGRALA